MYIMFIIIFIHPRALLKNGVSRTIKDVRDTVKELSHPTSASLPNYHDALSENIKIAARNDEEFPDYAAVSRMDREMKGRTTARIQEGFERIEAAFHRFTKHGLACY
jgi:hypothetical protein